MSMGMHTFYRVSPVLQSTRLPGHGGRCAPRAAGRRGSQKCVCARSGTTTILGGCGTAGASAICTRWTHRGFDWKKCNRRGLEFLAGRWAAAVDGQGTRRACIASCGAGCSPQSRASAWHCPEHRRRSAASAPRSGHERGCEGRQEKGRGHTPWHAAGTAWREEQQSLICLVSCGCGSK